ncbi:MAG TPA: type II toxin-antitoxin system RelE/ParE family toxin [Verrucomicrobiae bacterium]|nr:type II toxin-antitoxin system RelE/ParE family toxin [Verrucomicrobiae bacterium]
MAYRIEYSPDSEDHLRALTARQQAMVLDAVDEQLTHQPHIETKNRKPMRPNPVAPWELRVGKLRVYYDFTDEPKRVVYIRAVGIKERNKVNIGGEEIEL